MGGAIHLAQIVYGIFIMSNGYLVREYRPEDFDAVTVLWRIAREKSLPEFQREKGHSFFEDREYYRDHVLLQSDIWVTEKDGFVAAIIAMENDFINQFFVHPDLWRQGIGRMLLSFAKERSPKHLWLCTLQINVNARAFYEKNGFVAEKFGVSPPPENEPDVEHHWRGVA